jgi:hypothetical protein
MKRLSSKPSVLIAFAVMAGVTAASSYDDSTLSQLADYRHWTKINSEPVKVETQVDVAGLVSPGTNTAI